MVTKNWLPKDYSVPQSSGGNYMKFEQGANKFRILTAPIIGWEYWTKDNKPRRMRDEPQSLPEDIRYDKDKDGNMRPSKVKHFWALGVWDYKENKVQVLEITQAGIQRSIEELVVHQDWGNPTKFDITVNRKGEGLNTEYTVQPSPHKLTPPEALNAIEANPLKLEALFDGGDPFEGGAKSDNEEMMAEANPFGKDIL